MLSRILVAKMLPSICFFLKLFLKCYLICSRQYLLQVYIEQMKVLKEGKNRRTDVRRGGLVYISMYKVPFDQMFSPGCLRSSDPCHSLMIHRYMFSCSQLVLLHLCDFPLTLSAGLTVVRLLSFTIIFLCGFLLYFSVILQLTGPIQVIHHAKACCDVKGGKNELSFKQGEDIEIIRITDNPEGKWLGRTARGSCECTFS